MAELKKKIILVYCVAIIFIFTFVPWKFDYSIGSFTAKVSKGYSFILSPPNRIVSVDFQQIFMEFMLITAMFVFICFKRGRMLKK